VKKVSIVVAAYNVEKYIERCINSLINQTYNNIEVIVVNDKSTDSTTKVCEMISANDTRILVVNKEQNEGLSKARNTGIEVATGDYITFVDGDDFLDLDTISKCMKVAIQKDVDEVVFGSVFDRVDSSKSYVMNIFSSQSLYTGKEDMHLYFQECLGSFPDQKNDRNIGFTPWGRFYRKSVFDENNLRFISERELIYEDLTFLLLSTPCISGVAILNEPLYHYCENQNSLTQKCDIERYYKVKKMYLYIKETYSEEIFGDKDTTLRLFRTMIGYVRLSIMQLSANKNNIERIKAICNDEVTKEITGKFPVLKLPIKQMMFAFLLKYRLSRLLYLLCHFYTK
jgi:glycosyltransferase involved in cell wall biosynthesis